MQIGLFNEVLKPNYGIVVMLRLEESIHWNNFYGVIYDANLAGAFNFLDTFGQMSLICFEKFSS